jgi:hypothetical protein
VLADSLASPDHPRAGEAFFESPGDVPAVSKNASSATAKILAMVFTPKNGPVTIPG